jgi:predicted nucleotidyltransferase
LRKELPHLREKYGVEKVALYGSFVKETHTAKSDVDIIVQLIRPMGLEYVELANHLEELLGRKVDLATFDMMHRSMKDPRHKHIAADVQRTLRYV